jgi:hypothetical protein
METHMMITCIHPSRQRAAIANKVRTEWLNKADGIVEYVFSLDNDDIQGTLYEGNCIYNNNRSAIDAINKAAEIATGDLFVTVSDDFDCPEHWDSLLINELQGKEDYCVKTQDGLQPTLMTLPIMDRVYYERFGYIYHPDYRHMFCDQEMTAVAHMLGKVIALPLVFAHNHYSTGKFQRDAVTIRNNATWQQGERVFNERLKTNFGIENPVCKYSDIVWH